MVVTDDDIVTHILVSELNTVIWKFFNSTYFFESLSLCDLEDVCEK